MALPTAWQKGVELWASRSLPAVTAGPLPLTASSVVEANGAAESALVVASRAQRRADRAPAGPRRQKIRLSVVLSCQRPRLSEPAAAAVGAATATTRRDAKCNRHSHAQNGRATKSSADFDGRAEVKNGRPAQRSNAGTKFYPSDAGAVLEQQRAGAASGEVGRRIAA